MRSAIKINLLLLLATLYSIVTIGQNYKFKTIDSTYVFDKAKYHFESVKSDKLEETQAFVHTAFFIDWCIDKNLVNEKFKKDFANQIDKLQKRLFSPAELFIEMDGVFLGGILTLKGYNFAMYYFHLSQGKYLKGYERLKSLSRVNNSIYSIENTWTNFNIVKLMIDKKFDKWNENIDD